jgi:phosphoenolpyruvate synthase/pyruvate phosphate dikinase
MAALGLNIPPGFTLTTEVCSEYCASGSAGAASSLSPAIWDETLKGLNFVEEAMGKRLIYFLKKEKSAARISQSVLLCL